VSHRSPCEPIPHHPVDLPIGEPPPIPGPNIQFVRQDHYQRPDVGADAADVCRGRTSLPAADAGAGAKAMAACRRRSASQSGRWRLKVREIQQGLFRCVRDSPYFFEMPGSSAPSREVSPLRGADRSPPGGTARPAGPGSRKALRGADPGRPVVMRGCGLHFGCISVLPALSSCSQSCCAGSEIGVGRPFRTWWNEGHASDWRGVPCFCLLCWLPQARVCRQGRNLW